MYLFTSGIFLHTYFTCVTLIACRWYVYNEYVGGWVNAPYVDDKYTMPCNFLYLIVVLVYVTNIQSHDLSTGHCAQMKPQAFLKCAEIMHTYHGIQLLHHMKPCLTTACATGQ